MSLKFEDLRMQVFDLHAQRNYREALEVSLRAARAFPDKPEQTSFWIACLHSRLGELDEPIRVLRDAVGRGVWWSDSGLLGDEDLEPLRRRDDFQVILEECRIRHREAQAAAKPELHIFTPDSYSPNQRIPLLIALHGRGTPVQVFTEYWRPAVSAGTLLAVPQSSQVATIQSFVWDDRERAELEIAEAYAKIRESHPFNPEQVIVGGFSQGGGLAISIALKGEPFRSRGFIAVAPAVTHPEALIPMLRAATARGLKGCFLTGEKDHYLSKSKQLHEEMVRAGMSCSLTVDEGIGHEHPNDFGIKLASAIQFLLS